MSDNKAIAKLETTTLQDMQRGLRYCKLRETMAGPLTPARRDELRKARPISVHHARQWLDELLDAHDALARDLDVAREALEQTSQCPTCKGTEAAEASADDDHVCLLR